MEVTFKSFRANAGGAANSTIEEYFKINYFIKFVDHLVYSLGSRFPQDMSPSLSAGFLHSKDVAKLTPDTIADIYTFYKDDLPETTTPVLFQRDVELWQERCKLENEADGVALPTQS